MRFSQSLRLLGLILSFSGGKASPTGSIHALQQRQDDYMPSVDDVKNRDAWCGKVYNLGDMEGAKAAFEMSTLDASINIYIRTADNGPRKWLVDIYEFIFHEKISDPAMASNCALTGLTCRPGWGDSSCYDYFDRPHPNDWVKIGFWIYKAVQGMQAKVQKVKEKLTETTLTQGFMINAIAEDLGADLERDRLDMSVLFDGLGFALGVTSAVTGLIPGPGAAISAASGTLAGVVDAFAPEPPEDPVISLANVEAELSNRYNRTLSILDRTLKAAMGEASDQEDYKKLAGIKGGRFEGQITNVFSNPFWLLDATAEIFDEMLRTAQHLMQLKLVDSIMMAIGFEMVARNGDTGGATNKDECEGNGNPGRRWINANGTDWCFGLSIPTGDVYYGSGGDRIPKYQEQSWDSGIYEKVMKYGVDRLSQYYKNAIDCARKGGSGPRARPNNNDLADGYPICFFSIPVKRAKKFLLPGVGGDEYAVMVTDLFGTY